MERNKFMFFKNFAETIKEFPEEKQAEAYKAICEYGIYGILPEDESLKIMCLMAKASIFKEDGRKNNGGNHNPKGINQHSNLGQNRSILVNSGQSGQILSRTETETETEEEEERVERKEIVHPTEQEVLEYAKQMDMTVGMGGFECCPEQAKLFFAYYDKVGWLDKGSVPIVDWKKSFKYWVRRDDMKKYQKEQKC